MTPPRLSLLCARAALTLIGIFLLAPCEAAVVAEWDFRVDQNLTLAGGTAPKSATFINDATVNVGTAAFGDERIASGFLHCPRTQLQPSGSWHHGLRTTGTFNQFFGTQSLGEGTLVMVVRSLGNNTTTRRTLFGHDAGAANSEMWLYYNPPTGEMCWRVAGQTGNTARAALTARAVTPMETGEWYLLVATWKAGEKSKVQMRKLGSLTSTGGEASQAVTSTTNNGCNKRFSVGVRDDVTEVSDMDFAFVQLSNVRNDLIDGIYEELIAEEDEEVRTSLGIGVTLRADFSGSYAATIGQVKFETPAVTSPDNTVLGPGLFDKDETLANCGAVVPARPKQRIFCGKQTEIAPNFKKAGTLSFYWSPDFNWNPDQMDADVNADGRKYYLWGTSKTDDDGGAFAGRWEDGRLRAYFGQGAFSEVDMPVVKNRWYLIVVSWGRWDNATMVGRVNWRQVTATGDTAVHYTSEPTIVTNLGPMTNPKVTWGDSSLTVGSRIFDGGTAAVSGCRGAIDRVTYQDNVFNLSDGVKAIYNNTFTKYSANPLTQVKDASGAIVDDAHAQEIQFPSSSPLVRGYPYNALWRKNASMTRLGPTTTTAAGFRQVGDPTRWDYALKTGNNGAAGGLSIPQDELLPNALKEGATIRLLYKPDLNQALTGPATLAASGMTAQDPRGFRLYRNNQNEVTLEVETHAVLPTTPGYTTPKATMVITNDRDKFTDGNAWYYIAGSWSTDQTGETAGKIRVYARKMDPAGVDDVTAGFITNGKMPKAEASLPAPILLGSRPGSTTENAKGLIDEVLFIDHTDSAKIWGGNQFWADFYKFRNLYSFFDYKRSATERVRYIMGDRLMNAATEAANDTFPNVQLSGYGYYIPLEAKTALKYEPAVVWAKKYYDEVIINGAASTTAGVVPTAGSSGRADTSGAWYAYQMVKWFGDNNAADETTYGYDSDYYRDKAKNILRAMITPTGTWSSFVVESGVNAWGKGFVLLPSGNYPPETDPNEDLPLPDGDDYEEAAVNPQSRSYDRFASGLIGGGVLLGEPDFVTMGQRVIQTYHNAMRNPSYPIPPSNLRVGLTTTEDIRADSDSLYCTNSSYWAWQETHDPMLENLLIGTAESWNTHAFLTQYGHSRRKVELVNSPPGTWDVLYGDGKWNQIRGIAVGYAVNGNVTLANNAQQAVEYLRSVSKFGLYPARMKAGNVKIEEWQPYVASNFYDVQAEHTEDDSDNNNISRAGGGYIRDILYAYDATKRPQFLTAGFDLANATIDAGREYMDTKTALQHFLQIAKMRGVCRVKVTGSLGDSLKIVRMGQGKTVVDKPMAGFTEAVVYLPQGKYEFTVKRGTVESKAQVFLTQAEQTVPAP